MNEKENLYEMFPQWGKNEIDIIVQQYNSFEEVYITLLSRAVPDEVLIKFIENEKSRVKTVSKNPSTIHTNDVPIQIHTEFLSDSASFVSSPLQYSCTLPKFTVKKTSLNTAKSSALKLLKKKSKKTKECLVPLLEKK